MNIFRTGLLLIAAGLSTLASARELTPMEALNRLNDSRTQMRSISKAGKLNPVPVLTARTLSGQAAVYVFSDSKGNDGFVVLSADDQALPLLGYSDSGTFPADSIPPQMEWWLSEYAAQIEYARKNNISTTQNTLASSVLENREAIDPMLKTKWDQVAPYNDQCPLDGTSRTWTGCVATAVAQVMKYFEYPKKGQGQITYSIESLEKKVTMNFAQKEFDWDNMLDTYLEGKYNEKEASAVAYLMKACGYAVKMQYSLDASGALALNIRNGLVKYFDYDPNTLYTLRAYYSTSEWNNMIYENLKNVGPVVYGGGSVLGGGHSFVCDGYDGNGLFHFNWGWSGISDGYFALEALNPGSLGTGGGTGGGYNFTQDALIGLKPNSGEPVAERKTFITQEGELKGTLTGTKLKLSLTNTGNPAWVNYNPSTLYFKFGVMFEPQGDAPGKAVYQELPVNAVMLEPGYGVKPGSNAVIDLSAVNLSNGTYKMVAGSTVVARDQTTPTDGTDWVPIKPYYGMPNYVTVTVKDGKYTIVDHLLPKLKVTGEFTSPLYYGCLVKVKVTVENPGDIDRVSGFAPIIANDEAVVLMGESIYMDIPAHSTVTREWTTDMEQFVQYIDPYLNVPLVFSFFNEENFDFYTDVFQSEVTVLPTPEAPKINVTEFGIADAVFDKGTYIIPDPNNIQISAVLNIIKGYFAYDVLACLCEPYNEEQVEILENGAAPVFLTLTSRRTTFKTSICYPNAQPDKPYYIVLVYSAPGGLVQLTQLIPVRFGNSSGIEAIEAESGITFTADAATGCMTVKAPSAIASIEAFDLTGRRADHSVDLDGSTATVKLNNHGLTIIHARDCEGNSKVFKVVM